MHLRVPAAVFVLAALVGCQGAEAPQAQESAEPVTAEVQAEAPMPFPLTPEQAEGKVVYETMCWS